MANWKLQQTKADVVIRKKPCTFFNNGQGQCLPRAGVCEYDHSVVPDKKKLLVELV